MVLKADDFYALLASDTSYEEKIASVSTFKADIKKSYIEIQHAKRYFEALSLVFPTPENASNRTVFSCVGHLVKRIITQDPSVLAICAPVILPLLVEELGNSNHAARSTVTRTLLEYWLASPSEVEAILKSKALNNPNGSVKLESLALLNEHYEQNRGQFSFKSFTPYVVPLLADDDAEVCNSSKSLLLNVFGNASNGAKQDLYGILIKGGYSSPAAKSLIKELDLEKFRKPISAPRPLSQPSSAPLPSAVHSAPLPSSGHSDSKSGLFSLEFATSQPNYLIENRKPYNISSPEELGHIIEQMTSAFSGKETEFNWNEREKNIQTFRALLRGNGPELALDVFQWGFKQQAEGICKCIGSLRTSLCLSACELIKEATQILGSGMDPVAEFFLPSLIKVCQGTKKITGQLAAVSVNSLIINTSYSSRYLSVIKAVFNDKSSQAKIYAAIWLQLFIVCNVKHRHHIESAGGVAVLENCILRAISDANPGVREAIRSFYWVFQNVWPQQARVLIAKMDATTVKALERSRPKDDEPSLERPLFNRGAERPPSRGKSATVNRFGLKTTATSGRSQVSRPQFGANRNNSISKLSAFKGPSSAPLPTASAPAFTKVTSSTPLASARSSTEGFKRVVPQPKQPSKATPIIPSLMDLLSSTDSISFLNGANILAYVLDQKIPPTDYVVQRPVTIPQPDIVTNVLRKLFLALNREPHLYINVIKKFTGTDLIGIVGQFIDTELIINVTLRANEVSDARESLERFKPSWNGQEAFKSFALTLYNLVIVDSVDHERSELCMDYLETLAKNKEYVYCDNELFDKIVYSYNHFGGHEKLKSVISYLGEDSVLAGKVHSIIGHEEKPVNEHSIVRDDLVMMKAPDIESPEILSTKESEPLVTESEASVKETDPSVTESEPQVVKSKSQVTELERPVTESIVENSEPDIKVPNVESPKLLSPKESRHSATEIKIENLESKAGLSSVQPPLVPFTEKSSQFTGNPTLEETKVTNLEGPQDATVTQKHEAVRSTEAVPETGKGNSVFENKENATKASHDMTVGVPAERKVFSELQPNGKLNQAPSKIDEEDNIRSERSIETSRDHPVEHFSDIDIPDDGKVGTPGKLSSFAVDSFEVSKVSEYKDGKDVELQSDAPSQHTELYGDASEDSVEEVSSRYEEMTIEEPKIEPLSVLKDSWYYFESQNTDALLLEGVESYTILFNTLCHEIKTRQINNRGLRQLAELVKVTDDRSIDVHHLVQLLIAYLEWTELPEDRLNPALFLLNTLMSFYPGKFGTFESRNTMSALLRTSYRKATSRLSGLGRLPESRDRLLAIRKGYTFELFEPLLDVYDDVNKLAADEYSVEFKVLIIRTMGRLVQVEKSSTVIERHVERISSIISQYLDDESPMVRRDTYWTVIVLVMALGSDNSSLEKHLFEKMSVGRKNLVDNLLTKESSIDS